MAAFTDSIFIKKIFWPASVDACCGHCGSSIKYRPATLGVGEACSGHGIKAYGYFCSWPCARAVANAADIANSAIEALTTSIMLEFRASCDAGDDPDGHLFLRRYSRFSDVPAAPVRMSFSRYGGTLTDASFRATWADKSGKEKETYGDLLGGGSSANGGSASASTAPEVIVSASTEEEQSHYSDSYQNNVGKVYSYSTSKPSGPRNYQYSTGSMF